jgi:hypothetical protein
MAAVPFSGWVTLAISRSSGTLSGSVSLASTSTSTGVSTPVTTWSSTAVGGRGTSEKMIVTVAGADWNTPSDAT